MKDKNRKGFTLVELLVVIAILAVLATVSVVGYTTFIQKTNAANDKAVVAQINNVLMSDEIVNGKPSTIGKALRIIGENGLEISEILPTAKGHEVVYDISVNRFALLKDGNIVFANQEISSGKNLWKFVDNPMGQDYPVPETTENSLFLLNSAKTVTLSSLVGIEGTIETLNITDEANASIVVAGDIGRLVIDAPYATVDHYGVLNVLRIDQIGSDCYNEHGFLAKLEYFGTGKFVACEGAQFAQSKEEIAKIFGEIHSNVLAYESSAVQNSENVFDQKHNYTGETPHTCSYEQTEGSATCTEGGTSVQKCVICGNEITTETQEALGHDYQEVITQQPTCTESGTKTFTCARCGDTYVDVIDALGHTEEVVLGKAATCTETGLSDGTKCSVCGEILTAQGEIPALGHDYKGEITQQPTCTESGTKTFTCTRCTNSYSSEVAALGHTEEVVLGKAATCTETGLSDGTKCSVCGEILTAQGEIPALGHVEVVDEAIASTCTVPGKTEGKHCSRCNMVLVAQEELPLLKHADDNIDGKCDVGGEELIWKLVTSADTPEDGDTVIIVAQYYGVMSTSLVPISPEQSTDGQTISPNPAFMRFTLEHDPTGLHWRFHSPSFNKYLCIAAIGAEVGLIEDSASLPTTWEISLDEIGIATIYSPYLSATLRYNPSSQLFSCYTSESYINILLYRLEPQNSGDTQS